MQNKLVAKQIILKIPAHFGVMEKQKSIVSVKKRAESAWEERLETLEMWHRVYSLQLFHLLERIYGICTRAYDIQLVVKGEQIRAVVDGLTFVTTYYEHYHNISPESIEGIFGLRLWWQCPLCKKELTSDEIVSVCDLGHKLSNFSPEITHKCRRQKK